MATSGDAHLSSERLKSADKLTAFNENGESVEFGSLYEDKKAIIIFVRVWRIVRVFLLFTNTGVN